MRLGTLPWQIELLQLRSKSIQLVQEDDDPPIHATDTRGSDPLAPPPYAHETAEPSVPTEGAEGVEGVEGAEGAEGAEGIEGTEGIKLVVVTRVIKPSSRVAA